jgi:predicted transcriptional regulator of viral defense system
MNVDTSRFVYTVVLMASSRSALPSTFTYAQALAAGVSKHALYRLRDEGRIELLSRGLYRNTDDEVADLELVEIARRAPMATLCLTTALARHGLSDEIPQALDVALPRGTRTPVTTASVAWHHFERATFELGRKPIRLDAGTSIGMYSAERCIVDAFRTRATGGNELAYDALKRWLRRPGASATALLKLAAGFPRTVTPIRKALEILL